MMLDTPRTPRTPRRSFPLYARGFAAALTLALAAGTPLWASDAADDAGTVLIDDTRGNGGFEAGLRPWRVMSLKTTSCDKQVVTSDAGVPAAEGDRCLQVAVTSNEQMRLNARLSQATSIDLRNGRRVRVTTQGRTASAATGFARAYAIILLWSGEEKRPAFNKPGGRVTLSESDWVTIEHTVDIPDDVEADRVEIRIEVFGGKPQADAEGVAYLDAVTLEQTQVE